MATLPTVREKDPDSGTLYLRDGTILAFFLPMPFGDVAPAILDAFDTYLGTIPPKTLRWAAIGANADEWRPVAPATLTRCRTLLTGSGPARRSLTALTLTDGDEGGDAPGHGIQVIGNKPDPEQADEVNLFQVFYPTEVLTTEQVDDLVAKACRFAETLPYVCGYGSPALLWAELESSAAFETARGLVRRYPGYDIQLNESGRSDLGTRVRGARWLTFLGPDLVARLGGADRLRAQLPAEVTVAPAGHGLMVRAGRTPELGDRNRRKDTPLLRAVAAVLEPVTLFDEPAMFQCGFVSDDDELRAWERRFLD